MKYKSNTINWSYSFQCIYCMKEYEGKSPEELRWEDHLGPFGRRMGYSYNIPANEEVEESKDVDGHGPKPEIEAEKNSSEK